MNLSIEHDDDIPHNICVGIVRVLTCRCACAGGSRALVQQDAVEAEARDVVDDLSVRVAGQPHARLAARADEARQL